MKNKITLLVSLIFIVQGLFGQVYKTEAELQKYFKDNIAKVELIEGIWTLAPIIRTNYYQNRIIGKPYEDSTIIRKNIAIVKEDIVFKVYEFDENNSSYKLSEDYFINKGTVYASYLYFKKKYNVKFSIKKNYNVQSNYPVMVKNFSSINLKIKLDGRDNTTNELFIDMAKSVGERLPNKFDIEYVYQYTKTTPTKEAYQNALDSIAERNRKLGSAFAISVDGLIATNYHLIENVKQIKVKGIQGDFSKIYNAKLMVFDKTTDLAIVQIEDTAFKGFGKIPYSLKYNMDGLGQNIHVISYPRTAKGTNEIMNADGTVTSIFGIDRDAARYQFSTKSLDLIQTASSGCPVFDKKGRIIGILNAKNTSTENIFFAIKPSYLLSLIKTLPVPPKRLKKEFMPKPLAKKIKAISPLIFIVQ